MGKLLIFRLSVPVKSYLMVNHCYWTSIKVMAGILRFFAVQSSRFIYCSLASFTRKNKKSQPHSPSESVVYPENRRQATLSRSTFVSRNEWQAIRLQVVKLLSH